MTCGASFLQAKVGRLTAAVADHQNGDLIGAGSSGPSDVSASASRSRQAALSLERFKEEGLIGFDNAAFAQGPMLGRLLQKAVAPEKGRVLADATSLGCLAHTPTVEVQTSKSTA